MAEYRTIRSKDFWSDPFIEKLSPKAKLLYLYFFTGPHTNNLGLIEITRDKIAYETGLTVKELEKHIDEFEKKGKLVCERAGDLILVVNFIKHQSTTSPKILDGLKKLLPEVQSPLIIRALFDKYPMLRSSEDTLSIPYPEAPDTLSIPSGEREVGKGKGNDEKGTLKGEGGMPAAAGEINKPEIFSQVVEAYHQSLPALPRHQIWSGLDTFNFKSNFELDQARERIDFWLDIFQRASKNKLLSGREPPDKTERKKSWKPCFSWFLKSDNVADILNGKYPPNLEQDKKSHKEVPPDGVEPI